MREEETTMTTAKNTSCHPGATAPGSGKRRAVARRERGCCFYKLFLLFPIEHVEKMRIGFVDGNNIDNR